MAQHFEGDTKKFTLTAFISFATVFCVLMLFMRCHGDYKPSGGGHGAATESHSSGGSHNEGHDAATHDSTTHHKDSTSHSTEKQKTTEHKDEAHH